MEQDSDNMHQWIAFWTTEIQRIRLELEREHQVTKFLLQELGRRMDNPTKEQGLRPDDEGWTDARKAVPQASRRYMTIVLGWGAQTPFYATCQWSNNLKKWLDKPHETYVMFWRELPPLPDFVEQRLQEGRLLNELEDEAK